MMTKLQMLKMEKEKLSEEVLILFRRNNNYEAYYQDAETISKALSVELLTLDSIPTVSITIEQCNELLDAGYGVSRNEYRDKDGRYVPHLPELEEPLHMYEEELTEQRLN